MFLWKIHLFLILIFVKYNLKTILRNQKKRKRKRKNVHRPSEIFEIIDVQIYKNNMFPGCSHIFSAFLKHFGIAKWVNTGFYGFGNPEIMKMSSFDV